MCNTIHFATLLWDVCLVCCGGFLHDQQCAPSYVTITPSPHQTDMCGGCSFTFTCYTNMRLCNIYIFYLTFIYLSLIYHDDLLRQTLTWTTLGQLCTALWDSQSRPVVIQPGNEPGSVVTPLALRSSALDHCATWEHLVAAELTNGGISKPHMGTESVRLYHGSGYTSCIWWLLKLLMVAAQNLRTADVKRISVSLRWWWRKLMLQSN